MNTIKQKILVIVLIIIVVKSFGQGSSNQDKIEALRTVIPPSPNASAIAKYIEWPVSLYTGLPNIDIPIYEIKGKKVSVPISLSYHSGGNKVSEISSWVGLGWSLNAGGIISRSIRGLPDEAPNVGSFAQRTLYTNPNDLCSNPNDILLSRRHKVQAAKGIADSEQDVYNFSGLGQSFSFYIKHDGTVVPTKFSKVKITSNINTPNVASTHIYWNAIFEDGTKLEFGGANNFEEKTDYTKFDIGYYSIPTAWLLKTVTSTSGEVINFSYTGVFINQDNGITESDYLKYNIGTLHIGPGGTSCLLFDGTENNHKIKAARQQVSMLQLSTIESDFTKVEFELSPLERLDLLGAKALAKIKIYSKFDAKYIEVYKLNQTYSNAANSVEYLGQALAGELDSYKKRLKLISIEKQNIAQQTENKWLFEYNPLALPSRRSFATDNWGFYNGKVSSNTLLPKFWYSLPSILTNVYPIAGFNQPVFNKGVSRAGDGFFTEAEILKNITYPTGGKTDLYYEPNTMLGNEEIFTETISNTAQLNLNAASNPYTTTNEKTFVITVPQTVKLTLNSYISSDIFNSQPNSRVIVNVIKQGGNSSGGLASTTGISEYNDIAYVNLYEAGTYIILISTNISQQTLGVNDAVIASANITYDQSMGFQLINKSTGGMRLKRMLISDPTAPLKNIEKNYTYEQPLIISPIDIKKMYFTENEEYTCESITPPGGGGEGGGYLSCYNKIITRNSSTQYNLGSVQGGTVGYGKVNVLYGNNGINGKTVTEFSNEQDLGLDGTVIFPYPPSDSREWRRGLMLKQTDYNNTNTALKEITNAYQFINKGSVSSFKAGYILNYSANSECGVANCSDVEGDCGIQKVCYTTTSEQVNLISSTQKIYDQNGLNPLITITNYFYDNPNNLKALRVETVDSKGNVIKNISRTPLEKTDINLATPLTPTASAAIDSMLARNIIALVLQQDQYTGNVLQSRSLINYKNWTPNLLEPENIQMQFRNNPLETKLLMNAYDNLGNLLEQQKENDVKQSYIYGYNKFYPVAQVAGADYSTVAAMVDQTVLDNPLSTDAQIINALNNLRNGLSNTNALVTTYTYKPLVGITSQTDPNNRTTYYEYDAFNRLSLIRDHDNNILKKICYNYAGQVENCLSACPPSSPANWQNTSTPLRCQQGSCGNTGYQEQEQKDMNPCSPTYNQTQWVVSGQNTTACPLQTCVALTSTNMYGNTGFTASYYNTVTAVTYSFTVPAATGLQPLGTIPSGNYNLTISRAGTNIYGTYYSGCKFQALTGSTPVVFYNIAVSSIGCKSITLDPGN